MSITATYQPIGRFDATTAAQHQQALTKLLEGDADSLILDFSKVEFLSSAGLRVLLYTANATQKKSGSLKMTGARSEIREVIIAVGFDDIVHLED